FTIGTHKTISVLMSARLPDAGAALALAEHHELVGRPAGEGFLAAVRPHHLNGLDLVGLSQAEVGPRVVVAQIAVTGVDPTHPATPAGLDRDLRAVGIAV